MVLWYKSDAVHKQQIKVKGAVYSLHEPAVWQIVTDLTTTTIVLEYWYSRSIGIIQEGLDLDLQFPHSLSHFL